MSLTERKDIQHIYYAPRTQSAEEEIENIYCTLDNVKAQRKK